MLDGFRIGVVRLASFAALACSAGPALAATAIPSTVPAYLDAQGSDGFSGVVLVAHRGEVLTRAYGMADREWQIANDPLTRFRIGSLTKQFTAGAMLLLEQDGKLSLNDPLCKYIEPCPEAWRPIRLEQLLDHSSGIHDFVRSPGMRDRFTQHFELPELVRVIAGPPLDFPPGTDASYGNSGFVLSAYIIEKVSGRTYAEFMKDRIFKPLGMKASDYASDAPIIPHRARGYVKREGGFENAPFIDMSIPIGAGSQISTVGDLYLWDRALQKPGLFSSKSLAKMFRQRQAEFGLGWEVTTEGNRRVIEHNGDINGFGAFIARYPDDDAAIIIMTNTEGTKVRDMKDAIAARLLSR
jgi:D-alanyl-D-alanine carboxypeptidase